jgi:hypothetical protein
MKKLSYLSIFFSMCAITFLLGCSNTTDIRMNDRDWVSIPIREDMCAKDVLNIVSEIIVSYNYNYVTYDPANGYLRTEWLYGTDRGMMFTSRVSTKLNFETRSLRVFPECQGQAERCQDIPHIKDMLSEMRDRLK